ncbi:SUMF1/EgtB/PvdO family nonheme iron enzyme [Rhizobium sp. RU36D]|uniref:SUMF1/EgtB/PvdO family nonheme iron enzyme n=1 Tax=Rhizobium sp. RU36D TaxID=1907415 RepID=UPI0009D7EDFB|nr:SUMF1/EgtB/PvdO family nonheme iron enzyme [Rhizobium sp. RU36D]SMC73612.1 Formylglycine-generating enzyme, required for sulfatase activity, contains SUMF1/FGE domain [Rhizobium sp. RU36D]
MATSSILPDFLSSTASLFVPIALIGVLSGALAVQTRLVDLSPPAMPGPLVITVPAGSFDYREFGEFYRDGYAVDGPKTRREMAAVTIMKFQVGATDYDQCVAEQACLPRDAEASPGDDLPVTGVSHDDAVQYAAWLSEKTGDVWRLPKDVELAYAAGSKVLDDALGVDGDSRNPALRWLADYEREAARKASRVPEPQPFGHFGESEHGLSDFGGNVWEWTASCNRRVDLAGRASSAAISDACGVYIAAGKHRAPLSSFVRDPKGGGCAVGTPPDNVGFRLVKDTRWFAPLLYAVGR